MDTWINLEVLSSRDRAAVEPHAQRAMRWFSAVEQTCNRFDADSEISRLSRSHAKTVAVSTLLFEALTFAVELARLTRGAFDPLVGSALERKGFNRDYRTGNRVGTESDAEQPAATYQQLAFDRVHRTVRLRRPAVLDVNAVAKGLAVDLAARELAAFDSFLVEAGGDLYVQGLNTENEPWLVGVQHPRRPDALIRVLRLTNAAVCTSGDYERPAPEAEEHHILDARQGRSRRDVGSVTVVAPTTMAADGLSTAAMALGSEAGLRMLEAQGVAALVVSRDEKVTCTSAGSGLFS